MIKNYSAFPRRGQPVGSTFAGKRKENFTEKNKKVVSTLTVVNGASYVKVSKGKIKKTKKEKIDLKMEKKVKAIGNRDVITKFSKGSRSNMIHTVAKIRRDDLPSFVTLTYPKVFDIDPKRWKLQLRSFVARLGRRFEGVSGIWKLEPQRRGAPHYHIMIWGVGLEELRDFVPQAWNEIVAPDNVEHLRWHLGKLNNGNIHCVQEVKTQMRMFQYVTKYIAKASLEDWGRVGRWWGVLYRSRLPFGREVVFEITESNANDVIRYMRRYTRRGNGLALQSRQQVCDADQWMEKLQTIPMGTYKDWLNSLNVEEVG